MQAAGGLLAGMGILGMIGVILICFVLFGVIPIWAVFDCAASKREGGSKTLTIILLILFWGLGSLIYSLFLTQSKVLKRVTLFAMGGAILLCLFTCGSLTGGAVISGRIAEKENRAQQEQIISEFIPGSIAVETIKPFDAIHFVHGAHYPTAASAAKFTLAGPDPESAFTIDDRIRHLLHDDQDHRYYALTQHDFGVLDPGTHAFTKIEVDPLLASDFSWPKGLAFDAENNEVIILTSHVDSKFFAYNPKTAAWRKISTVKPSGFIALAYSPEERSFYALEEQHGKPALSAVRKFTRQGADFGSVAILPAIPVGRGQDEYFQMTYSSGKIILITPPVPAAQQGDAKTRIFVIDPGSGELSAPKNKEPAEPKKPG